MLKNNFLQYLEYEKRYSSHTVVSYKTDLTQFHLFLKSEFDIEDIAEVTHHIIRNWISLLLDSGLRSKNRYFRKEEH